MVDEIVFELPKQNEKRPFQMQLPEAPYSFSGQLVALIWGLELVVDDPSLSIREEIVLAPHGKEIHLSGMAGAEA